MHCFSQRLPVDWLQAHLAVEATHHLFPTLVQRLRHRPEVPLQWRCQQLLTVRTGEQVRGLLDVLPDTFDKIPETLDAESKKDIVSCDRPTLGRPLVDRIKGAEQHHMKELRPGSSGSGEIRILLPSTRFVARCFSWLVTRPATGRAGTTPTSRWPRNAIKAISPNSPVPGTPGADSGSGPVTKVPLP